MTYREATNIKSLIFHLVLTYIKRIFPVNFTQESTIVGSRSYLKAGIEYLRRYEPIKGLGLGAGGGQGQGVVEGGQVRVGHKVERCQQFVHSLVIKLTGLIMTNDLAL